MSPLVCGRRVIDDASFRKWPTFGACLVVAVFLSAATPAHALSEILPEQTPPATTAPPDETPAPEGTVPFPEPIDPSIPSVEPPAGNMPAEEEVPGDEQIPGELENVAPEPDAPLPQIEYDVSKLPAPVQRTRAQIIEAAKTGDIERLRPLIGVGDEQTQLSLGGIDDDPIKFIRELSGDEQGQEILAIIEEVLSAGYVHMEAGTANDFYVWPYFFAIPLDRLTPEQRVELFKIVTAGDYDDMKTYGAYIFYRIGITPDGKWSFFIAGD